MALAYRLMGLIPLLLSLGVHEWAHATVAFHLGDATADEQGRRTLNPLAHIDLLGTVLLPLAGVPFGWAKPVPVDPTRFRKEVPMGLGMLATAAAGPLSNLLIAGACAMAIAPLARLAPGVWSHQPALVFFLTQAFALNVVLAVVNVLPVPPLDGSRIVDGLIPFEWRGVWNRIGASSGVLLLALFLVPALLGVSLFGWVLTLTRYVVGR